MSLADQVRNLELLRERGSMEESEFERQIAELLRSVTEASEETIVDAAGHVVGDEIQGGPPPAHLGAYELMELLGQGGMGSVYLAKHLLKPGLFAVKVPRKDFLRRPGFGHHFKKEAGVGLRLDHPGIVRVLDLIIDGEWAAIVMQFVAGPNLEEVLQNNHGPLEPARVVDLMRQVLEAMDYAHSAGVLHRDLKPKNLLLHPSGQVKVTDFGVAGLIGIEDTDMGNMLGTAPYMAPELYTGAARIDQRTDIYALGMTLYKLLVGRLPFGRDMNPYQVLRAKEAGQVPLPADLGVNVPPHLVEVLFRALRPEPMDRFPSCGAFRETLLAGAGRPSVVPALVTSGPQTIRPTTPIRLEGPRTQSRGGVASSIRDTLPSLPALEAETRMSAGTLMTLLLVTALLAAVIALALSGDLHVPFGEDESQYEPRATGLVQPGHPSSSTPSDRDPEYFSPPHGTDRPRADLLDPRRPDLEGHASSAGSAARDGKPQRGQESGARAERRRADRASRQERRRKRDQARALAKTGMAPKEAELAELTADPDGQEEGAAEVILEHPSPNKAPSSALDEPPAPPRPEVTQPEGAAMGFLYLSARPECEVSIDGKSYGTTTKTSRGLILREGSYKVRFVCADDILCGSFAKRAGVKTLQVFADRSTRYEANFVRLNE